MQLYSQSQIKHRLNTNGLYITSTKPNGLTITVTNNDNSTIITGFRFLCGSQDTLKSPSFVSVGTRTISTNISSFPRWVDFGLNRSEIIMIQNENRLSILFGSSQSPDNITMIDNIKIYGTSKESFGWPEEVDEHNNTNISSVYQTELNPGISNNYDSEYDQYHIYSNTLALISAKIIEAYAIFGQNYQKVETVELKQDCLEFLSKINLLPLPSYLDEQIKKVMNLLIEDQNEYLLLKERLIINHVVNQFNEINVIDDLYNVDPELFYLMVRNIRQITAHKPNDLGYVCNMYGYNFVPNFYNLVSKLYNITPSYKNPLVLVQPGLLHVEFVFQVVIETILSYCIDNPSKLKQYEHPLFELLTAYNPKIRYTVKQSIIYFFKPKNITVETENNRKTNWNNENFNLLK